MRPMKSKTKIQSAPGEVELIESATQNMAISQKLATFVYKCSLFMAGGKMWTPNRLKFNGSLKQDTDGELEPEVGLKIWIAWQQHHPPRLYSYEK